MKLPRRRFLYLAAGAAALPNMRTFLAATFCDSTGGRECTGSSLSVASNYHGRPWRTLQV